jgi:arsenate reductase (thioredoxin)
MGPVYNVLFLCTGNSTRSVIAEVLLNEIGKDRFRAYSAGSHPTGEVNPFTAELLRHKGYPIDNLRSKSWDEFGRPDAPQMDFVITVCDSAAGETCPVWPGHPITAHWGFEDPAAFHGPPDAKRAKFEAAYRQIATRVRLLVSLPLRSLDQLSTDQKVREIGRSNA